MESGSHHLLGFKFVWHLLHPGSSWALLHRRLHRLLHHHPPLPLLPHLSQHARIPTEPEGADLVPHVLLLWVQCERARSQSVSLAFWKARLHENSDWIELSYVDQRLHMSVNGNFYSRCCFFIFRLFDLFLLTWAFVKFYLSCQHWKLSESRLRRLLTVSSFCWNMKCVNLD